MGAFNSFHSRDSLLQRFHVYFTWLHLLTISSHELIDERQPWYLKNKIDGGIQFSLFQTQFRFTDLTCIHWQFIHVNYKGAAGGYFKNILTGVSGSLHFGGSLLWKFHSRTLTHDLFT